MKVDLQDQVALVTGAAGAIGKTIADTLAANQARVIYSDIDLAGATRFASQSPGAQAMEMDICNEAQVQAVTEQIVGEYGRIDILVNNAGVNTFRHRVPIDQFPRTNGTGSSRWT